MPPAHFRHWMTTTYSQIHFMSSIVSGVLFPSLQHPKDDIQFLARWHCAIESQPIIIFFHQTLL